MAGNWSVTVSMPAQNLTDYTGTIQWTACTSQPYYFTVQTAPVNAGLLNGWPYSPLPNSNVYWNYPINSNNREWAAIAANWGAMYTTSSSWQPYGSGPSTGHILWDVQGLLRWSSKRRYWRPTTTISYDGPLIIDGICIIEQQTIETNGPT